MIRYIYAFFIGILLTVFIGVGVAAFYPGPEPPAYPDTMREHDAEPLPPDAAAEEAYHEAYDEYTEVREVYARNVSLVTLGFAVLFLAISLSLLRGVPVIADGLMLGGLFTLIYSIGWSFMAGDKRFIFVVVTVGLALSLLLGYLKFIKPEAKPSQRSRS